MSKKISPNLLEAAIVTKTLGIKRKREIYSEIKKFNTELASIQLNEVGMVGSFGFAVPNDVSNKTKTGFVGDQPLSHVKELMNDFSKSEDEAYSKEQETASLREEVEALKKELEAHKKQAAPKA